MFSRTAIEIITFVALVCCSTNILAATVSDCSGEDAGAKLGVVKVIGCSSSQEYCPLVQGSNSSIEVEFETVRAFEQAALQFYGVIAGIPIPFWFRPDPACGKYGFECPVGANEKKKLQVNLPILKTYPRRKLTARVRLDDGNSKPIVCVDIPVEIVKS